MTDNLISTTYEKTILDGQICPFCKKSDLKIINKIHGVQIKCNCCERTTGVYPDTDELIGIWNHFCGGSMQLIQKN